ncbi:MAG: hypothetical protein LH481_09060 [Burkholderiales bacterium]|nr:hypothetical protein [Burkholderiales bacterium]
MKLDHAQQKIYDSAVRVLRRVRVTIAVYVAVIGLMLVFGWHNNALDAWSFRFVLLNLLAIGLAGLLHHVYRALSETAQLLQEIISADPQALSQQISRRLGENDPAGLRN